MGLIEKGLEVIYPSNIYCIGCGSVIDKTRYYALCDKCIEKFHWVGKKTCDKCGKILNEEYSNDLCYDCRMFKHSFEKGYTCVQYGLYERQLIMDYKNKNKAYMGKKIGDILYDRIRLEGVKVHGIIPVPMHRKKQEERGYNQTALMARQLAKRMELPFLWDVLLRTKYTQPMKGLGSIQREENLKDAFEIKLGLSKKIEGKAILLVDDIYTTGSTMDACSKVLLKSGAEKIIALSFAAGGNRKPAE
ncbi:MAG: ComF family protein [Anaerovoracaceae bacterium]